MSLTPGTRVGPYEIATPVGAGGMGEVYRARDTRLNRDVAIKVLPDLFAADRERLARFEREAQTLASLNHPNIAHVHGLEESGGVFALVMELVEGEDLSQRIARGAIPLDEAVPIARQIAEALETAHEQGIVHRDLKPANIKVRPDGTVKVLDFGLAKAMDVGQGLSPDLQNSPTFTSPAMMTRMGVILGTAAYMAPEQARGKSADRRADIWAFGCVLYEMLTGRRPFDGEDVSSTLANVLKDDVRWDALPAGTPASIRRLLRRCLEKDPKRRWSAIGDARLELDEAEAVAPPPAAAGPAPRGMAFAVAAALALAAIAAVAAWYGKPAAAIPLRLLELPASVALSKEVVLSPDGTRVAYFLDGHLYVRALDSRAVQDLGSMPARADNPFWSPDSRTVGFTAESEIRTVPAAGGPVFVVCRIPATGAAIAATWLRDGTIVFAAWRENVYAIPAAGGTPVVALAIDPATEIDVHHISAVPDGRLIVKIHQRSGDRGVTALVDPRATGANQRRVVLTDDQTIDHVDYAPPGFLIFDRERTNAGLWAAPFSGGSIDLTKATLLQAGAGAAVVADDGSLIFVQPAASRASPVWVDRAGVLSATPGGPFALEATGFALSPDGRRVAVIVGTENDWSTAGNNATVVVRDLGTGVDTPLTVRRARQGPAANESLWDLAWFPSGDRVLLTLGEVEAEKLVVQKADDATPPRELAAKLTMGRLTRDGQTLAAIDDERGWFHLVYAPVSADGTAGARQRVFRDDDPDVVGFDLSPDGRFVVFTQRLPDRRHAIFLSEFPNGTTRWQVADGAARPRFSADGREIFYVDDRTDARGQPERALMSRTLSTQPGVTLGAATVLFGGEGAALISQYGYGVTPDGRRFLTLKDVPPAVGEGKRIMWMQNWPAAMKK